LEFIIVADHNTKKFKSFLLFIDLEAKYRDVHYRGAVPIRILKFRLELLLGADIKLTQSCVEI
jgi:hypothetical protein